MSPWTPDSLAREKFAVTRYLKQTNLGINLAEEELKTIILTCLASLMRSADPLQTIRLGRTVQVRRLSFDCSSPEYRPWPGLTGQLRGLLCYTSHPGYSRPPSKSFLSLLISASCLQLTAPLIILTTGLLLDAVSQNSSHSDSMNTNGSVTLRG